VISIDWDGGADSLQFTKDAEGALVAAASPAERLVEAIAAANDACLPHIRTIATAERWPLPSSH
jgi:hypothetical protein